MIIELTFYERLERLHAAGERITQRVIHNPKLLAEDALCTLLDRITQLMLKIGRRYLTDAPVPNGGHTSETPNVEGDDWGWFDEISDEWDEDKDVHR